MQRKRTRHVIRSQRIKEPLRLAVAADLHSAPFDDVMADFRECDAVLIPGDLVDRHRRDNRNALRFLEKVPEIRPVFYAIGNHERKYRHADEYMEKRQAEMDAERQACAMELDYVLWKIEVVETSSKERLTKKQGDVFTLIYVGHKTYHEAERILWKKRKRKLVDRNIAATKQAILKALSTELELRCDCLNEGEYILRLQRELEECNYG